MLRKCNWYEHIDYTVLGAAVRILVGFHKVVARNFAVAAVQTAAVHMSAATAENNLVAHTAVVAGGRATGSVGDRGFDSVEGKATGFVDEEGVGAVYCIPTATEDMGTRSCTCSRLGTAGTVIGRQKDRAAVLRDLLIVQDSGSMG